MKSLISIATLTLAAWAGSAAALHPGSLCSVMVPEAYSFEIEIPRVPAFYAAGFREIVLSRTWSRLHKAYLGEHRGLKERLGLIFDDHYFALLDPLANPEKLIPHPSLRSERNWNDHALLYVFGGIDRVAATHPNHLLARRVLQQMVIEGELIAVHESPHLATPVRAVWSCQ